MFDRQQNNNEKAILICVNNSTEDIQEFHELATSAGAEPVVTLTVTRRHPDAKFYVGKGKIEEIATAVEMFDAGLVMFNHELSPAQERNIEQAVKARVLNRTGLILDIFAQRARTFEGKLQVELAQLEHIATRLVRGWTHLERQKGGIGLRGPGETQLEVDRRLIRGRIKNIKKRLEKVRLRRDLGRQARKRKPVPSLSIVGYTNAGKSTLFNHVTSANVYAADKLFATLDPTLRRVELPEVGEVVLADTVGFIRQLPHDLVDAFRATLEEAREADLLLHVIDFSTDNYRDTTAAVEEVLKEIDADTVPYLKIFNKIDLLEDIEPRIEYDAENVPQAVYISAQHEIGLDLVLKAIIERLSNQYIMRDITLTPEQGKLRASLYAAHGVLQESIDEEGHWHLRVKLPPRQWAQFNL
tara:strand:- start:48329 stop:49570 length:1242 start_codon:yes stop_codon:yes gene_type:complete